MFNFKKNKKAKKKVEYVSEFEEGDYLNYLMQFEWFRNLKDWYWSDSWQFFFESEKPVHIKNDKFFKFFYKINSLSFILFNWIFETDMRPRLIKKREIRADHLYEIIATTVGIVFLPTLIIINIVSVVKNIHLFFPFK